jgi:hypothetical protein
MAADKAAATEDQYFLGRERSHESNCSAKRMTYRAGEIIAT